MSNIDFCKMFGAYEFQNFARDMVQVKEGIFFESFSEGADLGIDGRCALPDGTYIILQAKRVTNINAKMRTIAREEKRKMDELVKMGIRVGRYILVLADTPSVEKKKIAKELLAPYVIKDEDIIGGDDLNNLLDKPQYAAVEEKYYRLWIQNTKTLQRILFATVNSEIVEKSKIVLQNAKEKSLMFVETDIYVQALKQLRKNKILIISGEPGVGKTTLAEQVALYSCAKWDVQSFAYVSKVSDLYTVQKLEGKKVILFDDFWGSNGFAEFGNGRDVKDLVMFMEYMQRTNDIFLIMTTREYILEQGLKRNEDFRKLAEKHKLDLQMKKYSLADRLQIYLEHLKNSALTWPQIDALFQRSYQVIHSPNYNPRVVDDYLKSINVQMPADICGRELLAYLNCPTDFWNKIWNDLSREAKIVYIIMASMPLPVEWGVLETCYGNVLKSFSDSFEWKEFGKVIAELEQTVVRTDLLAYKTEPELIVTYQNPSVRDYIIGFIVHNLPQYGDVLKISCCSFEQCIILMDILEEVKGKERYYQEVMKMALHFIKVRTIDFREKYLGWQESADKEKLKELYCSRFQCGERSLERWFQLFLRYDQRTCAPLKPEFENMFYTALKIMEESTENLVTEELNLFTRVAVKAFHEGICKDIQPVIELCMNYRMKNRLRFDWDVFEQECKKAWEKYKRSHQEEIFAYLVKFYHAEFCLAAVKNDWDSFTYWDMCRAEDWEEFDLPVSEELRSAMELYAQWVDWPYEEAAEKDADFLTIAQRKIDEIYQEFEDYINEIPPVEIEDVEEWLQSCNISEEAKELLNKVWMEGDELWYEFLADDQSAEFLCAFAESTGQLPHDLMQSVSEITSYIKEHCQWENEELYQFFFGIELYTGKENVWCLKELEEIIPEWRAYDVQEMESLAEAKILVKRNQWYRLANKLLVLAVLVDYVQHLPAKDQIVWYKSVFADRDVPMKDMGIRVGRKWETISEYTELFYKIFSEAEPEIFGEAVMKPLAEQLYSELYADSRQKILDNLIEHMDMKIKIDEESITYGGTYSGNEFFGILEKLEDFWLFDIIPDEIPGEQVKVLKEQGLLAQEESLITLKQLADLNMLESLGIEDGLWSVWEKICHWRQRGVQNGRVI